MVIPNSSGVKSLVYIGNVTIIIPKEIIEDNTYRLAPSKYEFLVSFCFKILVIKHFCLHPLKYFGHSYMQKHHNTKIE